MELTKDKAKKTFTALKGDFGLINSMQAPKLVKVVLSVGIGSFKDPKKKELVPKRLAQITGQKPALRVARESIASFKLREGDPVGYQVTLRGARMNNFVDKLLNVALPRTKDFRGISLKAMDDMGNYTLGIKEHTIFPEVADEELKDVFGLAITIVTTAKNKKEAKAFFDHLGFPFKKEEEKK